eukprot:2082444-Pleurochrysis_carterae.AAC.1
MHWRKLGRPGHGGKGVTHVLTTCLIEAQETEGRGITHGNEGAKRGVIRGAEQLSFRGIPREVEHVPIA